MTVSQNTQIPLNDVALRLEELQLPSEPRETFATPRSYGWLGDHQDEAAELAALLHEAAPKLALASLRAPLAGARPLPRARSGELSDAIKDRLRAAVPMPTGPGQIDWSRLTAVISSELLKLEDDVATAAAVAAAEASSPTPRGGLLSPRSPNTASGNLLEINSGGRVMFCLFDIGGSTHTHALTPPCSLRNSPDTAEFDHAGMAALRAAATTAGATAEAGEKTAAGETAAVLTAPAVEGTAAAGEAKEATAAACHSHTKSFEFHSPVSKLGEDEDQDTPQPTPRDHRQYSPQQKQQAQQAQHTPPDVAAAAAGEEHGQATAATTEAAAASPRVSPDRTAALALTLTLPSPNGTITRTVSSPISSTMSPAAAAAAVASLHRSGRSLQLGSGLGGLECGAPGGMPPEEVAALASLLLPPPAFPGTFPAFRPAEGCLVLKFVPSRLLCQSEQFASELTRHMGLCAPDSRILRQKGASEAEWREACEAALALKHLFPELHEELSRNSCCLVMEFIPGSGLFKATQAFDPTHLTQTALDLGRCFCCDMLLGNADRLHCKELSWRGNPGNIMYASGGRWEGRVVAIDAVVQRRPPGGLMSQEDNSCERLTELALNDAEVAGSLLRQAMKPCQEAEEAAGRPEAAKSFQQGLRAALDAVVSIKGLLEMMFEVVTDWIEEFIRDIEEVGAGSATNGSSHCGGNGDGGNGAGSGTLPLSARSHGLTTPRSAPPSRRVSSAGAAASPLLLTASASTSAQTMRIRQISHEAQRNDSVGERVARWKAVFREKGEELRAAVEEWQQKRGTPAGGQRLTTAFLDGTHPIVDVYELKVRLEHMLQRLRVLQQATLTGRPCRLMPRLYLSGAVEASSHHLLKHMGITHVLNATEDLLLPEERHGFVCMRVPLRDVEEEDLAPVLPDATAFIDEGLRRGGSVLVHCHAGKSRSCSLVLAWLMTRRRWTLKKAMQFLQRERSEAAPNAGYLAALLRLEEQLFGMQTVKMKKTKPEPRSCPECGEKVGLSAQSVRVHLRLKHPGSALARSVREEGHDGGSSNWGEQLTLSSPTSSSPRSSLGALSSPSSVSGSGLGLISPPAHSSSTGLPSPPPYRPQEPYHHHHQQQQQQQRQQQQQQHHRAAEEEAGEEVEQRQQTCHPQLAAAAYAQWPAVAAAAGAGAAGRDQGAPMDLPATSTQLPVAIPAAPSTAAEAGTGAGTAATAAAAARWPASWPAGGRLAAVLTAPPGGALSEQGGSAGAALGIGIGLGLAESPPSIAAVLQAEIGGEDMEEFLLSDGDDEEFLSIASPRLNP